METEEIRITLRLPSSLRDRLLVSASEASRSMNGEIIERLEAYDDLVSASGDLKITRERISELEKLTKSKDEQIKQLNDQIKDISKNSIDMMEFSQKAIEELRTSMVENREMCAAALSLLKKQLAAFTVIFDKLERIDPQPSSEALSLIDMGRQIIESSSGLRDITG